MLSDVKIQRLRWKYNAKDDLLQMSFTSSPYIMLGKQEYFCHQGKDYNKGKKDKYTERKKNVALKQDHAFTKSRKHTQPSKHLLVLKTSWRSLQDMSWRHPQHVFNVTILRLLRRLEDVLKTCLENFLKTCLEDVLKTCLEDVLKMFWRQTKYFLGISVYLSGDNKSKYVSSKSNLYLTILWIQNALIRTQ